MRKSGFTLLELLIAIAIIAILTGAIVPIFRATRLYAQRAKALADMEAIKTAWQTFNLDTGKWPHPALPPPYGCSYDALMDNNDGNGNPIPNWNGPYLDEMKADPWGQPYQYFLTADAIPPTLVWISACSKGPDCNSPNCCQWDCANQSSGIDDISLVVATQKIR